MEHIKINPESDRLVETHGGSHSINGYYATCEVRENTVGMRYEVTVTHPDGRSRIDMVRDGVRWTRYPAGTIEITRLTDGANLDTTPPFVVEIL